MARMKKSCSRSPQSRGFMRMRGSRLSPSGRGPCFNGHRGHGDPFPHPEAVRQSDPPGPIHDLCSPARHSDLGPCERSHFRPAMPCTWALSRPQPRHCDRIIAIWSGVRPLDLPSHGSSFWHIGRVSGNCRLRYRRCYRTSPAPLHALPAITWKRTPPEAVRWLSMMPLALF